MKIGKFEDRIAIETKSRITKLWCEMIEQFNVSIDLEKNYNRI